jgi:hypothetical protein
MFRHGGTPIIVTDLDRAAVSLTTMERFADQVRAFPPAAAPRDDSRRQRNASAAIPKRSW